MTNNRERMISLERRRLLQGGAGTAVSMVVSGCASGVGGAFKTQPNLVDYRASPNGKERCDNCRLWQPPAGCQAVAGPISPQGWCRVYTKA